MEQTARVTSNFQSLPGGTQVPLKQNTLVPRRRGVPVLQPPKTSGIPQPAALEESAGFQGIPANSQIALILTGVQLLVHNPGRPGGRRGRPQLDSLKVRFKIRPAFAAPTSWARRLQQHNRLWPRPQVLRVASPMENPGMWCGRLGSSRFKRGFLRVHLSVRPPLPEVCGGRFHLHCLNSGSQGIGMHGCACRNSRFPLAENLPARIVRAQSSVRCCAVFIFTECIPVERFRSCRVPVLSMFPQSTSVSR